jgi:large subunit ribosomal protein L23
VDVEAVNTVKIKGKTKTQFTRKGRFEGKTPTFKKAIVTLKEGQTIDLFGEV